MKRTKLATIALSITLFCASFAACSDDEMFRPKNESDLEASTGDAANLKSEYKEITAQINSLEAKKSKLIELAKNSNGGANMVYQEEINSLMEQLKPLKAKQRDLELKLGL